MNVGEYIYIKRKKLGLTLSDVGIAVGVGKSTVKKWESGSIENMKRDKIALLAKVLKVNPSVFINETVDIANVDAEITKYDNILPIETKKIPLIGEIACGEPIFTNEDFESYVECGTTIRADFALKCKGDSMINARIYDGDIVFIKKQSYVDDGQIAVVIIDDTATLKRVYKSDNQIMLLAENTAFKPLIYVGEDIEHISILGLAIAFQGDVI